MATHVSTVDVVRIEHARERAAGEMAHHRTDERREPAAMLTTALSSALIATGAVTLLTLVLLQLSAPLEADRLAHVANLLVHLDAAMRRDALMSLAFEFALAWSVLFIALLWWRGGVIRAAFNPNPEKRS